MSTRLSSGENVVGLPANAVMPSNILILVIRELLGVAAARINAIDVGIGEAGIAASCINVFVVWAPGASNPEVVLGLLVGELAYLARAPVHNRNFAHWRGLLLIGERQ